MIRGQWANLARMPGLHPYSFLKDMLGFLMTTESQELGLTSHPNVCLQNHHWLCTSLPKFGTSDLCAL